MTTFANAYDLQLPPDCPLDGSIEREMEAYRIVKADQVTQDDLKTHQEAGTALKADACQRAGVSLFDTHKNAQHRMEISPHLGTKIAKVNLTLSHGKVSNANAKGHMDWWAYAGMRRPSDFTVAQ